MLNPPSAPDPSNTNYLLDGMSKPTRGSFVDSCEEVPLAFKQILAQQGEPIEYVYFPLYGYISQITAASGKDLEVALTGNEGMFGLAASLGTESSHVRAMVQGSGSALRMTARRFRQTLGKSKPLSDRMRIFTSVSIGQLIITAECSRFHSTDQRLARWLLMTADRAHSKRFRITHQFLSYMLGSRRVGITVAARKMHLERTIRYGHGEVEILDFERLRAASCNCYRHGVDSYDAAFGRTNGYRTSDGPRVPSSGI